MFLSVSSTAGSDTAALKGLLVLGPSPDKSVYQYPFLFAKSGFAVLHGLPAGSSSFQVWQCTGRLRYWVSNRHLYRRQKTKG